MTVAELKKQYKTFAAAKAAIGIKAQSWDALAKKLDPNPDPIFKLQAEIDRLKAENEALKQQLGKGTVTVDSEYQSDYFKSAEAELIYSIVKLDGEDRINALNVGRNHYRDAKKAKNWRNDLANKVHPDKCHHPDAPKAISKITEIYQSMVA